MPINQKYIDYISNQLSQFQEFYPKKMFGGLGFFRNGIMFAMISSSNQFYFRTDESSIPEFEKYGMENFNPYKKGKGMPYWTVPTHVIEDKYLMKEWAEKAFRVALKAKK